MNIILCLTILFVSISCTGQKNIANNKCEEQLAHAIAENWKYDSEGKYYRVKKSFIKDLHSTYFDCIKDKDATFILDVFGNNPKERSIKNIKYAISLPCNSTSVLYCEYFEFIFSKDGKLKSCEETSEDVQKIK